MVSFGSENTFYFKKIRIWMIKRRLFLIIALLAFPLVIMHFIIQQPSPWVPTKNYSLNKDFASLNVKHLIASTQASVKKSEAMTPQEYADLVKVNPQFPPTLDQYRKQLKARLAKLQNTTDEKLSEEMSDKVPALQWSDDASPGTQGSSNLHSAPNAP